MKKNSPLLRKTVVRKMKASGIPKCEIINITGHRHERGLDPYDSGDENEQRFWSNVTDKVPFVPVTQSSSSISLPFSAVPQNQFPTGPITKKLCCYYCQTKYHFIPSFSSSSFMSSKYHASACHKQCWSL